MWPRLTLDAGSGTEYGWDSFVNGRLAQLVARFLDMEEVAGSSPATTTISHISIGVSTTHVTNRDLLARAISQ
jgi:hypothetical protein